MKSALPLVVDLTGRLVVAVGGGPVSARRVRAFVDEGAVVRVVSPWVCEDLRDLVLDGTVEWQARDYTGAGDLDGAWLVHTAVGEPEVDRRVAGDAERLRIWCVDATDASARSASVAARTDVATPDGRVTISTYAAGDPGLATSLRDGVAEAVTQGRLDLRRTRERVSADAKPSGWVALVGGGPGSDGLLTARGHELLRSADVVVVDRLAPRGLLERLPASVRVVDVGKTPGHHAVPQWRINEILVEEASRGLGVVRLKGGDPYVLGRGGEERQACEAAGLAVEVVPGVTSAVSVPAAAGIPVTHRGVARGFTVVTGHEAIPGLPTGGDHTLVLLMGVSLLEQTVTALVAQGRSLDSPVAIVERGFSPTQRTTVGTLSSIAELAREREVGSPAVIVVGDVVRLSPEWPGDPAG
ncbi:uroporphyrinogen-III C-methyltransferase [Intrasporangium calvum]|uniref:uroporphyrinogen-III C-methyltransferase n=1 Tax=Intrasporangium calvum (strain ATCC 23552 / DSM 43043 / JCM 3097 / NBRC 12989 / NCIMB 10167 / NRRL B-3866 / 7 KIP) TaxID=710696 RepID=E6SEP5_INTC7|nr:uroporphyrinogen-III C-methyltransferase [Intrasporangium calvum]ADU46646.1 uroporphyrinogen-III C-methyltransferase [Intrasporangium calvum DSM 43043]